MLSNIDGSNRENPATTHTLQDFINMKSIDNTTYRNLSILEKYNNIEFVDHNLLDEYKEELDAICTKCELTDEEFRKYQYSPDALAYDVYGSTQLDFLIMAANNIVDPKDFNMTTIYLPYNSVAKKFLAEILSRNASYIEHNRYEYNITT